MGSLRCLLDLVDGGQSLREEIISQMSCSFMDFL